MVYVMHPGGILAHSGVGEGGGTLDNGVALGTIGGCGASPVAQVCEVLIFLFYLLLLIHLNGWSPTAALGGVEKHRLETLSICHFHHLSSKQSIFLSQQALLILLLCLRHEHLLSL
jgi:hypothetical protein